MNKPYLSADRPSRMSFVVALGRMWFIHCLLVTLALAQGEAALGTISGRVSNAATGVYLSNAEVTIEGLDRRTTTAQGGTFVFNNVPAGDYNVSVSYTGLDTLSLPAAVLAGESALLVFELKSKAYEGEVVALGQFTVTSAREGNAKAIADQKVALNVKNVIAADAFGDVAEGNVGEFLKLLEGITVDYVDADVRAIRVRGLPPKYAAYTLDGHPVATSASSSIDTGRQFEVEQVSLATLEVVEVNKSPLADMAASNLSGNINTVSKSAFSTNRRIIRYNANVTLNQYAQHFKETIGWDNQEHYKALPGGQLEFSDTFLDGHLGLVAAVSHSGSYAEQRILISGQTFDRNPYNNQSETPIVTSWNFQHGLKPTFRDSVVVNLDYKVHDDLKFSLRTSYNFYDAPFFNRNWLVNTNTTGIGFNTDGTLNESVLTGTVNRTPTSHRSLSSGLTNTSNSYAAMQGSNFRKYGGTFITNPAVTWRTGIFKFDASGQYSQSRNKYDSGDEGYFSAVVARFPGLSWDYTSNGGTGVAIRQVNASALSNTASFLDAANYNGSVTVNNERRRSKDQFWSGRLDAEADFSDWKLPTKFKVGGDSRLNVRDIQNFNPQWTLNANAASGGVNLGDYTEKFRPDIGKGTMVTDINGVTGLPPSLDKWRLFDLFKTYNTDPFLTTASGPFTAASANNLRNYLQNQFDIKETINSLYSMGTVELRKGLTLIGGIRYEKTETSGRSFDDIGEAKTLTLAPLPAGTTIANWRNTSDYIMARYGTRRTRTQSYDNFFPSAQVRYEPRRNLVLRGAYFSSILRPDFGSVVGGVTVGSDTQVAPYSFTVRNTELKPEKADNFDVRVEYYFEPVGVVSLGAFYKDIKDIQVDVVQTIDPNSVPLSIQQLGFTGSDLGASSTVSTRQNAGNTSLYGLEAVYRQELAFLPQPFKGFGVEANFTYTEPDDIRLFSLTSTDGMAKYAGNLILRYKRGKFSVQGTANWTDKRLVQVTNVTVSTTGLITPNLVNSSNRYEYIDPRLVYGLSTTYQLRPYAQLFFNWNNITNEAQFRYAERPLYLTRHGEYGSTFNLGVKGTF